MKRAAGFAAFFILFSLSVFAHGEIESVEAVLSGITASQNVTSIDQIECSKVSGHQFEELGDALMEEMHPGEAHEGMDAMMGGEGSDSLEAMHVSMGKSYLRCDGSNAMMGSMMNGMMQGSMMQGMMGNNAFGFAMPFSNQGYWSVWSLLYAVLLIGLIALVFLGVFRLWKDLDRKGAKK